MIRLSVWQSKRKLAEQISRVLPFKQILKKAIWYQSLQKISNISYLHATLKQQRLLFNYCSRLTCIYKPLFFRLPMFTSWKIWSVRMTRRP